MPNADGGNPGLYAGIDFGTSGCRVVVIDETTKVVAREDLVLPPPTTWQNHIAQSPEIWWDALKTLLSRIANQIDLVQIRSIAIDGTSGTVLLTDAEGNPLFPALMYNDSCPAEAVEVARHSPVESGARGASSGLAKLAYLLGQPGADKARNAFTQADWLAFRLTQVAGLSDENNGLKLGYDPIQREWPSWLAQLHPQLVSILPRCIEPGTAYGPINPEVAQATGLKNSTQIVAGTTDSNAAVIATGVDQTGDAVTSLGSTIVLKVLSDRPVFAPKFGVYSHRLGDRWLVGGASNAGGAALLRFFSREQLETLSHRLDPQRPTGLQYYPLPRAGERFPISDPTLSPCFEPRPDDDVVFLQAMLEGLTRIEVQGYRLLAALGAPYPTRVLTCGGAKNLAWQTMRELALKIPVSRALRDDAAFGCALLAKKITKFQPT